MNFQELEKHVKFDLIFTLLVILGVSLCFLLSIVFIFKPTSVKAKEITNTININSKTYMPCGSTQLNGKYCAYSNDGSYVVRNINTTYNGVLNGFTFQFGDMISSKPQYTMIIEAMSTDFRNNNFDILVYGSSQSDTQGTLLTNYTYSFISKSKLQIIFTTDNYNYHTVIVSGNPLTGVSTYGIKKVTLSYDDGVNDNSDIINSNTQNTNDIIDNANSNTNDIIDASAQNALNIINNSNINFNILGGIFKDMLANLCKNVFDWDGSFTQHNGAIQQTASEGSVRMVATNSSYAYLGTVINVKPNTRYYVRTLSKSQNTSYKGGMSIRSMPTLTTVASFGGSNTSVSGYNGAINNYFDSGNNTKLAIYLFVTDNSITTNNIQYDTIMISETQGETFCPFGSVVENKLDILENAVQGGLSDVNISIQEQTDLQQDQYNYLTDDSNPTVNTSDINNVIGQVNIQDPLNYLLTLPINLLTKLNIVITSGTCSKASFGELYGTELYLPCINFENYLGSSLWGTIDTIVGIGLLAIILKKFYDSISNILSLGKEEEVRKGMELPTPMEFFAQILGGGK